MSWTWQLTGLESEAGMPRAAPVLSRGRLAGRRCPQTPARRSQMCANIALPRKPGPLGPADTEFEQQQGSLIIKTPFRSRGGGGASRPRVPRQSLPLHGWAS